MKSKTLPLGFWRIGLAVHTIFVTLVIVLADLGRLPPILFFPGYDLVGHLVLVGLMAFFLNGVLKARLADLGL